jgi:hypothetical protein
MACAIGGIAGSPVGLFAKGTLHDFSLWCAVPNGTVFFEVEYPVACFLNKNFNKLLVVYPSATYNCVFEVDLPVVGCIHICKGSVVSAFSHASVSFTKEFFTKKRDVHVVVCGFYGGSASSSACAYD